LEQVVLVLLHKLMVMPEDLVHLDHF
jgi:hypothetical protein